MSHSLVESTMNVAVVCFLAEPVSALPQALVAFGAFLPWISSPVIELMLRHFVLSMLIQLALFRTSHHRRVYLAEGGLAIGDLLHLGVFWFYTIQNMTVNLRALVVFFLMVLLFMSRLAVLIGYCWTVPPEDMQKVVEVDGKDADRAFVPSKINKSEKQREPALYPSVEAFVTGKQLPAQKNRVLAESQAGHEVFPETGAVHLSGSDTNADKTSVKQDTTSSKAPLHERPLRKESEVAQSASETDAEEVFDKRSVQSRRETQGQSNLADVCTENVQLQSSHAASDLRVEPIHSQPKDLAADEQPADQELEVKEPEKKSASSDSPTGSITTEREVHSQSGTVVEKEENAFESPDPHETAGDARAQEALQRDFFCSLTSSSVVEKPVMKGQGFQGETLEKKKLKSESESVPLNSLMDLDSEDEVPVEAGLCAGAAHAQSACVERLAEMRSVLEDVVAAVHPCCTHPDEEEKVSAPRESPVEKTCVTDDQVSGVPCQSDVAVGFVSGGTPSLEDAVATAMHANIDAVTNVTGNDVDSSISQVETTHSKRPEDTSTVEASTEDELLPKDEGVSNDASAKKDVKDVLDQVHDNHVVEVPLPESYDAEYPSIPVPITPDKLVDRGLEGAAMMEGSGDVDCSVAHSHVAEVGVAYHVQPDGQSTKEESMASSDHETLTKKASELDSKDVTPEKALETVTLAYTQSTKEESRTSSADEKPKEKILELDSKDVTSEKASESVTMADMQSRKEESLASSEDEALKKKELELDSKGVAPEKASESVTMADMQSRKEESMASSEGETPKKQGSELDSKDVTPENASEPVTMIVTQSTKEESMASSEGETPKKEESDLDVTPEKARLSVTASFSSKASPDGDLTQSVVGSAEVDVGGGPTEAESTIHATVEESLYVPDESAETGVCSRDISSDDVTEQEEPDRESLPPDRGSLSSPPVKSRVGIDIVSEKCPSTNNAVPDTTTTGNDTPTKHDEAAMPVEVGTFVSSRRTVDPAVALSALLEEGVSTQWSPSAASGLVDGALDESPGNAYASSAAATAYIEKPTHHGEASTGLATEEGDFDGSAVNVDRVQVLASPMEKEAPNQWLQSVAPDSADGNLQELQHSIGETGTAVASVSENIAGEIDSDEGPVQKEFAGNNETLHAAPLQKNNGVDMSVQAAQKVASYECSSPGQSRDMANENLRPSVGVDTKDDSKELSYSDNEELSYSDSTGSTDIHRQEPAIEERPVISGSWEEVPSCQEAAAASVERGAVQEESAQTQSMPGDRQKRDTSVVSMMKEAQEAFLDGRYHETILKYSRALNVHTKSCLMPSTVESLLLAKRAAVLLVVGAYETAAADCRLALAVLSDPSAVDDAMDDKDGGPFLQSLLLNQLGMALIKISKLDDAESSFNDAIQAAHSAWAYCGSHAEQFKKQFLEASEKAATGLSDTKQCREALNSIARSGTGSSRIENVKALHHVDIALKIASGDLTLHEKKVSLLAALQRWNALASHCERLAATLSKLDGVFVEDLEYANPYPTLSPSTCLTSNFFDTKDGQSPVENAMLKLSRQAVAEAVLRIPHAILPFYLKALRLEERYDEAEEAINALRMHTTDLKTKFSWLTKERDKLNTSVSGKDRGDSLFRSGKFAEAASQYAECLKIDVEASANDFIGHLANEGGKVNAVLHCNRAACLIALSKFQEAVMECTAALKIHPHYMKAMLRRCRCYARLERYEDAIVQYTRYLDIVKEAKKSRRDANWVKSCLFDLPMDVSDDDIEQVKAELDEVSTLKEIARLTQQSEHREKQASSRVDANQRRDSWRDAEDSPCQWDSFGGTSPRKVPNVPFEKRKTKAKVRAYVFEEEQVRQDQQDRSTSDFGAKNSRRRPQSVPSQDSNDSPRWNPFGGKPRSRAKRRTFSAYDEEQQSKQEDQSWQYAGDLDTEANHYTVLQVHVNSSSAEIKKAYRKLALMHHPDKNPDPDSADKFRRINVAYEVLSDDKKRRRYNREIW